MKFLLVFVVAISAVSILVEGGCIPADGECTAENFDPYRYCDWCKKVRQGKQFHMDPFHHSFYYQCGNQPIHNECGPCTYWLDDVQTCGFLINAQLDYPGDEFRIRQPYGNTCNRYYECGDYGVSGIHCCDGTANYFDKENAQFDLSQPACVVNEDCTDLCYGTQGPVVTETTTRGMVYEVTCAPASWPFGYHLLVGTDPPCYLILNADGTSSGGQYCCAYDQTFDMATCGCKNPGEQGCLKVHLPMDEAPISDVVGNNYVDSGTVTVTSEGRGSFSGAEGSSAEIPYFSNKFPSVVEMTLSLWFFKIGGDAGLVSNGDCTSDGSVNIWVEGNTVRGGVLTGNLDDVFAAMIDAQAVSINFGWHHVVLTYKKVSDSDSQYCLYLDGALAGMKNGQGPIVQSAAPIILGRQFCLANINFSGYVGFMDEFRYYECYYSAAEVQQMYTTQLPNFSP